MKKIIKYLTGFIFYFLFSCELTESDVEGKYLAKHDKVNEYIEIHKLGDYEHYLIEKNDTIQKQVGKWSFYKTNFDKKIVFDDFYDYYDPTLNIKIKPKKIDVATSFDGKTICGYDTGEYQYFRVDK
jgi:hypothetical protein